MEATSAAREEVVRAACPHDCPDTCAMLVNTLASVAKPTAPVPRCCVRASCCAHLTTGASAAMPKAGRSSPMSMAMSASGATARISGSSACA